MFFNESLDKTLWLMLISDKGNRGKIINFINDIPKDVFNKIRLILNEYQEYENNDVSLLCRRDICLMEEIDILEYKYIINLDMCCHSLSIIEYDYLNNKCRRLVIYFNNRINNIELLGQQTLGSFYSNEDDNIVDVSYDLVDTLLGKAVAYSNKDSYKRYKIIFMRDIPEKFVLDEFSDNKKLVKNKKTSY